MSSRYEKLSKAKPSWTTSVIIESHINGMRSKDHNPNIPVGYDEVAAEAIKCWEAGACGIHLHNTNIFVGGEEAYQDYMKTVRPALNKYPDMFWYATGTNTDGQPEGVSGVEHSQLLREREGVRLCTIDCGSANLPFTVDENGNYVGVVYSVPYDQINKQVAGCERSDLGIIWGVYEPGYLRTALQYIKRGRSTKGSNIDLYFFGDYGSVAMQPVNTTGVPPTIESLYFYLDMMGDCDLPWFISIWGEGNADTRPLIKRTIELGGHVKTGLELHFDPDRRPTNVELLQEVQGIAKEVGRPIARQDEVKGILGLE